MNPRSLHVRLLGIAALWVVIAVVLVGLALLYLLTITLEHNTEEDLAAGVTRLVAQIDAAATLPVTGTLPDPQYQTPASGQYWQVIDIAAGTVQRSRSLWDRELEVGLPDRDGASHLETIDGPDAQRLVALTRRISFETPLGRRSFAVTVARDRLEIDTAVQRYAGDMAVALLVLALAMLAAAWAQVTLGLKPLELLQRHVEAIRHGRARRLGNDFPVEIQPLVGEVNDLLQAREASLEFARARAGELAHSLKTPLAVLAATAEQQRLAGNAELAETLAGLGRELDDRIDYQLRLARLNLRARSHSLRTSLNQAILRPAAVLQKTADGERLDWRLDLGADEEVDMDARDLLELTGILLENACKWADSCVSVRSGRIDGQAFFLVADDGPGLAPEEAATLGIPGKRLDASKPGHGLGLAIAKDMLALNGGTIAFERAAEGGMAVRVTLPLANA